MDNIPTLGTSNRRKSSTKENGKYPVILNFCKIKWLNLKADTTKKIAATKSNISKWSRDELEDRYLRMYEEDIMLKKHARKQEDRIKQ